MSNAAHSLKVEIEGVHNCMIARFNAENEAKADIERAKKMEEYLRAFKAAGNQRDDKITTNFQNQLKGEAMETIAAQVGTSLGIGKYSLFRNAHNWYLDSSKRWGADDVFEAELANFLWKAGQAAINKKTRSATMGISIVGGQSGNISTAGRQALRELDDLIPDITKTTLEEITKNGQKIISKTTVPDNLIQDPTFRSGKVDVNSYNAEWVIDADIRPEWQDFMNTFAGARFTVKNYSSKSQTETIHIGNTNPYKAIYSTLSDSLGYNPADSAHIYYHTVNFYTNTQDTDVGEHIIHLRFAYELSGSGLYDSEGNRLDDADFFIYNDPSSNNIWVRSVKGMIAEITDYIGNVANPLTSGVVLLKRSF